MRAQDRIILPLDVSSLEQARPLVVNLAAHVGYFKIGKQLIFAVGAPQAVKFVHDLGGKVFVDGKLNDIPHTVGEAASAIASSGVAMFNVHASAGIDAMMAAVALSGSSMVLAVTVLTSFEENDGHLTFGAPIKAKVLQFARNAKLAGVNGIICSPQELELLRKREELKGLLMVTPGVRPAWAALNDQKRVMTPGEAIKAGADYLVIGRPITNPPEEIVSPVDAVQRIVEEIDAALTKAT